MRLRRVSLVIVALIGLSSGFALAGGRPAPKPAPGPSSPGCGQYKTWQTCNADLRCMWYGPYCGPRLE